MRLNMRTWQTPKVKFDQVILRKVHFTIQSVLITIGVGLDTTAEQKFRNEQPNAKFYGADPISQVYLI